MVQAIAYPDSELDARHRPYEPFGGALELWLSESREVAIVGPAGTGKTRGVLELGYWRANEYPGSRHLFCRKTRASMTQSVLVTWESKVIPELDPVLSGADKAHRQEYVFPNGSTIVVGGLDNPDRIMSTEYDTITVFEATEVSVGDYEMLLSRLRNGKMPRQQVVLDLNPASPSHWIYTAINDGPIQHIVSRHSDNPTVTKEYLETLSRLTGPRRARLYLGQWAGAEGLVYDNWDRAVHVRDAAASGVASVVIGVDDGYTNPFAALRLEVDGDMRVHVAEEVYASGMQVSDRLAAMVKLCGADEPEAIVIDPSSPDLIAAARAEGLSAKKANNEVLAGINRVAERLGLAGDGRPRLTVSPTCKNIIREMESYEWMPDKPKDTPKKENDHACDALRYGVMYLDKLGGAAYVAERDDRAAIEADRAKKYPRSVLQMFEEKRRDPNWGF